MSPDVNSIRIFSAPAAEDDRSPVRRGLTDSLKSALTKTSDVAVGTLQENMQNFMRQVDRILGAAPKDVGGLVLDEVEIHAQIDTEGNIGIAGIAGAQLSLQGGMRFVLRKKTGEAVENSD